VAVVDSGSSTSQYLGLPVLASFAEVGSDFDAIVVTDMLSPQETLETARAWIGADRVFIPKLLSAQDGGLSKVGS
jgi:hypothetical protein